MRATPSGWEQRRPPLMVQQNSDWSLHNWLDSGGNEHDLMRLMGWINPKMVGRYAASTDTERALRAHQRRGPGDKI